MSLSEPSALAALAAVPSLPRDEGGPVFEAPWQAKAFAMALALHQRGLFEWTDWAQMLGVARAASEGAPDTGETCYGDWLVTLERMVTSRALADGAALGRARDAWRRAAARTPHGAPIELSAEDFS